MAAIFQAIGNQSAGAASVAVAWPAHVAGDLGLMVIETGGEGTTLAVPSGWTAVTGSPVTDVATTAGSKLQVWYKFAASGAEANVNTGDSGDHQVARIVTFRGIDPTTPFDVTPVAATKTTASTTVTWNTITTATANALIVLIATRPDDSLSTTAFSNPVNANLTGLVEHGEGGSNAGHGGGFVVVSGTKVTAGAVGTTTMTCPSVTNAELVIALRPDLSTGTLSVSETGSDTFSASGTVTNPAITGTLAATETGSDTLAATGSVFWEPATGTLAATETGADSLTATGSVSVRGSLAATEAGSDTFAATGVVTNAVASGSLAATETGADTFAATADLIVKGSLAVTEVGADTLAATGDVFVSGSLSATEVGSDTISSEGVVKVQGSLAATETGQDVFAATGEVADVISIGTLAATETGSDTLAATGAVSWSPLSGSLSAIEAGSDTLAAEGDVKVAGSLAATEAGADTFAATGKAVVRGSLAVAETGADVFAATGGTADPAIVGTLSATETGADAFASEGIVRVRGSLAVAETGSDVLTATGKAIASGSLAAVETGADVFAGTGDASNLRTGTMAAQETTTDFIGLYVEDGYANGGYVQQSIYGSVLVEGSLGATESGSDTAFFGRRETKGVGRPNMAFTPVREVTVRAERTAKVATRTRALEVKTSATVSLVASVPCCKIASKPVRVHRPTQVVAQHGGVKASTLAPFVVTGHKLQAAPAQGFRAQAGSVSVTTSSAQIVVSAQHKARYGTAKPVVTTVINPTDDEVMAIISLMRQRRAQRLSNFR